MPGDYTRVTFNPFEDHLGVLMQQGRVLLDADFNELVEILDRRSRAGTLDTIGRCAVPKETPDGFRIQIAGPSITIGRGRIYVDGLLAENHGLPPLEFDRILAEQRGTLPVPYNQQPYFPNAATLSPLTSNGPNLVYVDVWQREITHLEEPDLIEKAVGVDTATRLQTVWQVKALPVGQGTTCATPDGQIPAWTALIQPSAGRLTTAAVGAPKSTDPCIVNPAGGYRGTENRLYRVEVHDGGPLGTATFKWSRDNGSVATSVTALNAGRDELTVTRTARDSVLRFSPGDWVEVTDDFHELAGKPGILRKIQKVDDVTQVITLAAALPAGEFDPAATPTRHTRVRRWDQKGKVLDAGGTVVADVDTGNGVIKVSAAPQMVLEDGVQVAFTAIPGGGQLRTGDYWIVAARTVDASVEELVEAPPKGIHHHYCRLAVVTFPNDVQDCRPFWPPDFGETGCDCTECVSAEEHNSGKFTIQMAIEKVKATGGKVCLGPGLFNLGNTPVVIDGAQSVQVQGHGWKTMLVYAGDGAAVEVTGCTGIDLERFSVFALSVSVDRAPMAVAVRNSILVRIERCVLLQAGTERDDPPPAVGLGGFLIETFLRDNVIFGATGIQSLALNSTTRAGAVNAGENRLVTTFGLYVEDNVIAAQRIGVSLDGLTLHMGDTRISGNSVYGGRDACILARGRVFNELLTTSRLEITGNEVMAQQEGDGIVVACDNARVVGNDIGILRVNRDQDTAGRDGIALVGNISKDALDRCQVIGNRISRLGRHGIAIRTQIGSAMIKQNFISETGLGGIVMEDEARAEVLSIENNHLLGVSRANDANTPLAAIRVSRAEQAEVASNTIQGFALFAVQNPSRVGIEVLASSSVRIAGNDLSDIGPAGDFVKLGAGIEVVSPFDRVDVVDNSVRRNRTIPNDPDNSHWNAVRIRSAVSTPGFTFSPQEIANALEEPPKRTTRAKAAADTKAEAVTNPATGQTIRAFSRGNVIVTPVAERFLFLTANIFFFLAPGDEITSVRGNLLEAYGNAAAADVQVRRACVFSDNRSTLTGSSSQQAVIEATTDALIFNANYTEGLRLDAPAIRLLAQPRRFTVLGNATRGGDILVNNSSLADPWRPLNVFF